MMVRPTGLAQLQQQMLVDGVILNCLNKLSEHCTMKRAAAGRPPGQFKPFEAPCRTVTLF
jgi:hypothetical protein